MCNIKDIHNLIKLNIEKYQFNGALIGISGGIDSAVVGKLLVDSLGNNKVFGLILPERDTAPDTIDDAKLVCNFLDIKYKIINITKILRSIRIYTLKPPALFFPRKIQSKYAQNIWNSEENSFIQDLTTQGSKSFKESLAYYRVKPRIRTCMFYFEAEKRNYSVIGCTNKTEALTGFYTKWGDESCDIEPIVHLYKTQVYELAQKLHIPKKIINKKPSPDIAPGITDEFALGIEYKTLDRILIKMEKNESLSDENENDVKKIKQIVKNKKFREIKQLHL